MERRSRLRDGELGDQFTDSSRQGRRADVLIETAHRKRSHFHLRIDKGEGPLGLMSTEAKEPNEDVCISKESTTIIRTTSAVCRAKNISPYERWLAQTRGVRVVAYVETRASRSTRLEIARKRELRHGVVMGQGPFRSPGGAAAHL